MTTTSHAVLGLLAIRPWSTYELTQQMERSIGHMWPRAPSKLYEEPKKLVAHGLATASRETVGKRPRTVYAITDAGREALASWLAEPGSGPVVEFEQLLQVFFADHGTRDDTLRTLAAARDWAGGRSEFTAAVGTQYETGEGPFPERRAQLEVTVRFLIDFYALVGDWARWAAGVVEGWPADPSAAAPDADVMGENQRRAQRAARRARRTD